MCLSLAPVPGAARDAGKTGEKLQAIEKEIESKKKEAEDARRRAEAMAEDIGRLNDELVVAARAVQEHERQVLGLNNRLTALARLRERKTEDLKSGREKFGRLLSAMQRIALYPPEAMIAQPTKPADTVRTAIMMRAASGEIERKAVAVRDEIEFIEKARTEIAERQRLLAETTELLDRERRRLGALMSRKNTLKRRADQDAQEAEKRLAKLAGEAETLRDLLQGIEKERARTREREAAKPAKPAKQPKAAANVTRRALGPISKAQGRLAVPVVGRITGRYGEKTDAGLTRKGITMSTNGAAQVIATYDGTVVYAGKFRGYGLLLIIEHGEGYHTLLAGMARLDAEQGQTLVAGEPVGVMEDGERGQPVLYVELRRDGQPINPLPWLAAGKGEVNG